MSKIVQAINAMISNPNLINNIHRSGKEYFFLYKNKYRWSISCETLEDDDYLLFFYPGNLPIENLSRLEPDEWDNIPLIRYQSSDIGTKEAKSSMAELYNILKERIYGIDEALDDIISG